MPDVNLDDLRRKIKALLAKAKGNSNPHEAMACAAKAAELLEKYNLDVESLDAEVIGQEEVRRKTGPIWYRQLAKAAALLYGCRIANYRSGRVIFIGREGDRMTAMLMLEYFTRAVNRASREYVQRNSFRRLMANALLERAGGMAADKQRFEAVDEYMKSGFTQYKGRPRNDIASSALREQAKEAADKVGFARQAMGKTPPRLK